MAVERFAAPTRGQVFRVAPSEIPKNMALDLRNVLVHHSGKLPLRGPLGPAEQAFTSEPVNFNVRHAFVHGDSILFGDNSQELRRADLFGTVVTVSASIVVSLFQVPGTRSARVGSYAYAFSYDAGGGGSIGELLRWDGTTTAPARVDATGAVGSNTPHKGVDTCAYLERLFVAGTRVPGTGPSGTYKPNAIFWSDLGGPVAGTLAEWQDDVSGLVNQIEIGSPGDPIVALVPLRGQLLVLKRNSVYTILGDTPANFVIRRVANGVGCVGSRSVLANLTYSIFFSDTGLMLYDGSEIVSLGGPAIQNSASPATVPLLSSNYIVVVDKPDIWMVHLPTQSWVRLSASTNVIEANQSWDAFTSETGRSVLFDGRNLRHTEHLTTDDESLRPGRESIASSGSTYEVVAGSWTTRVEPLAMPTSRATTRRVFLDHQTVGDSDLRWDVTIMDGSGAVIGSSTHAAAAASDAVRQRSTKDIFAETSDVMISVAYAGTTPTAADVAELHDIWVEYDPAQRI